jgi:hypothetical protein
MNEANLQQNLWMHLIGRRPEGVQSATKELVSSGAASGIPDKNALARVSGGLGEQKLVTHQRITVGLTEQRLEQLGLHDVAAARLAEMDAADQIPNFQRLGAAVARDR